MPAAGHCVRRTRAGATAALGRWRRRTRNRSAGGGVASARRRRTLRGSSARSTPTPRRFDARPTPMSVRTIKVDSLARVEGEGALAVTIKDGAVTDVTLDIFEPPRFFEALLRGRKFDEAPDITARICGICPVAYQMSSVQAIEDAFGVAVDAKIRALRRLLYCGEWIESHALHIYMLHAPDFMDYPDAIQMAKDHPELVRQGLELKKAGNEIVKVVG